MIIERPALYLVGTPIGNLGDLSPRAEEIIKEADFIAAEDTRVCAKLLFHIGVEKQVVSYFQHNLRERGEQILAKLREGKCCALVTDAGMPAISDPGEDLVRLCADAGIPVHSVPGPSAAITALALSGLPTGRFTFEGFLSTVKKNRATHLSGLRSEERTMLFYEAPHKLKRTLDDLVSAFGGERRISIARELTKLHEEVLRMTLAEAADYYTQTPPKGEFVLVLEGKRQEQVPSSDDENPTERLVETVEALRSEGTSTGAAVKRAAELLGIPRNAAYALYQAKKQP